MRQYNYKCNLEDEDCMFEYISYKMILNEYY